MGILSAAVREARRSQPPPAGRTYAAASAVTSAFTLPDAAATAEASLSVTPTQNFQKEGRFTPREVPSDSQAWQGAEPRVPGPLKAESGRTPGSSAVDSETDRRMHSVWPSTREDDKRLQLPEVSTPLDSFNRPVSSASIRGVPSVIGSESVDVPSDRDANLPMHGPEEKLLGRLPGPGTPSEPFPGADSAGLSRPAADASFRVESRPAEGAARSPTEAEAPAPRSPETAAGSVTPKIRTDSAASPPLPPAAASVLPASPIAAVRPAPVPSPLRPAAGPAFPAAQIEAWEHRLQALADRLEAVAGREIGRRLPGSAVASGPVVRIGQVDVFITAPVVPAKPAAAQSDRAFLSRNYLRRV